MNASARPESAIFERVTQRRKPPSLDASPVAHAVLDDQHRVQWANAAWTRLTGTIATAGAPWMDWVHPDDLLRELALIARLQDGTVASYECHSRLRRAGAATWIPVGLRVVRLSSDEVLVAAEPLAGDAGAPAAAAEPPMDEHLAATLSHDFRQHLRLITSYLSLVERQAGEALAPRQRTHLGTAYQHAERLQGLIADLVRWLRLAHEEPGGAPCSLDAVWRQVLTAEEGRIAGSGARIELPADLPAVRGDQDLLCEVFTQLLRNALQYHGANPPVVRIGTAVDDGHVQVTVADEGQGVPVDDLERVVKPFLRLHSWEQVPGNGMGLSLARRIVERHGGSLWLERGENGGCMAQVRLPG